MDDAHVVLVSSDCALAEGVKRAVETIPGCCFTVERGIHAAMATASRPTAIDLLILHPPASRRCATIDHLFRRRAAEGCPKEIVLICDEARPKDALHWLDRGAADCLTRPVELSRVALLVNTLTLHKRCPGLRSSRRGRGWLESDGEEPFYCESAALKQVVRVVHRVADRQTNILLTGATGSGKTQLARLIHTVSNRQKQPFLAVNCAAIPETLLESELFGHAKGAFTGASVKRLGAFAQVGSGTLLLDEIDMLPFAAQAKLLHVVEDRRFMAIGESIPKPFKGRLIFASNQLLEQLVEEGGFRADLYYRIKVVELAVPPLRERRSEIGPLAEAHLVTLARRYGEKPKTLSPLTIELLQRYDWPGNVRELQNVLERASLVGPAQQILPEDLPLEVRCGGGNQVQTAREESDTPKKPQQRRVACASRRARELPTAPSLELVSLEDARGRAEADAIKDALFRHGNNRTQAARSLGVSRAAFYKKLATLNLS